MVHEESAARPIFGYLQRAGKAWRDAAAARLGKPLNRLAVIWHDLAFETPAREALANGRWAPAAEVAGPLARLHRSGYELVLASAVPALAECAEPGRYSATIDELNAAQRALRHAINTRGGVLHATLFSDATDADAVADVLRRIAVRRRPAERPVLLTGLEAVAEQVDPGIAQVLLVGPAYAAHEGGFESLERAVAYLQSDS